MTPAELHALADRVERATGPDRELDAVIVEMCYRLHIPLACYEGRSINYDPALWQERHGFEPTGSIDAAIQLVPEGWSWYVGSGAPLSRLFEAIVHPSGQPFSVDLDIYGEAITPAQALTSVALRARAGAL